MSDFNFFAKKYKLFFLFSVINIFLSFFLIKILALDIVSIVFPDLEITKLVIFSSLFNSYPYTNCAEKGSNS